MNTLNKIHVINGICCQELLDFYFSGSFFMQGLGYYDDHYVPPAAAYSHGIASQNGSKAEEANIHYFQARIAEGDGKGQSRGGGRG